MSQDIECVAVPEFDIEELKTGPEEDYKRISDEISNLIFSYQNKMVCLVNDLFEKDIFTSGIKAYYIDEFFTHIHLNFIDLLDIENFDALARELDKPDSETIDSLVGIRLLKDKNKFVTGVLEYPRINDVYYFYEKELSKEQEYYRIRTMFTKRLLLNLNSLYIFLSKIVDLFNQHIDNFNIIENANKRFLEVYRYRKKL